LGSLLTKAKVGFIFDNSRVLHDFYEQVVDYWIIEIAILSLT